MWCRFTAIFTGGHTLSYIALVSLVTTLVVTLVVSPVTNAAAGIYETINFQGRLLQSTGAVVNDGYYNIQFKIYQDGTGDSAGNPGGSLLWTENYINNNNSEGVQVKNGFLSVNLGSVTAFGSSIDWDQDTLWLSMNVAGSDDACTTYGSAPCTADGEMLPMKRMTSSPYALNSGRLGGLSASNFIQLAQGVQADASVGVSSIFINKTNTGNLLQLQNTAVDVFTIDNSGDLTFGNNADHTINVTTAGASTDGNNLTLLAGTGGAGAGNAGGALSLQGGAGGGTDGNGGGISINSGNATGTGTAGGINIGTANNGTVQIGNITSAVTQAINIGTNATASSETNVTIGSTVDASSLTLNAGSGGITIAGDIDSSGFVDAATGFKFNGTSGATTTCNSGEYLQQQVVAGGITTGGTCTTVGGGSITLQNAYDNSGASPIVDLDSTGNGILFRDNATPIGGNLFAVQNSGATTDYFAVTASGASVAGTFSATGTINGATISGGTLSGGNVSGGTLSDTALTFGASNTTISLTPAGASTAGGDLTIQAGEGGTGAGSVGGALNIQGGDAGGTNANGGDVNIDGGAGTGTGVNGLVSLGTPTFKSSGSVQACTGTTLNIAQSSVDSSGTIPVASTYSAGSCVISLPDPTITTAGRVLYITADNTTTDNFTLSVNGGGTGNEVAMRANTTATMVWNGDNWAAAGASSSTTLQSAYDNTIQNTGGAELIVANTGNTNGLTIRDSTVSPVNGPLVSIQSSSAANLFAVSSNVTEYVSNPGAETAGASSTTFPASTWTALGSATVSREDQAANIASGQGSAETITTAAANDGIKNQLVTTLTSDQHYNLSFTTRLTSGTFTDMQIYYSIDGSAASVLCTEDQAVKTKVWSKINCSFTTPSSGITSGNAILIRQETGVARTFYVDNLSVTIAADFSYATDGKVNDNVNFTTNWTDAGAGTVSVTRNTTDGQEASDSAQADITSGAAYAGVRNLLSIDPLPSTLYRISVFAKQSAGSAFTDFMVRYSPDNGSSFVDCVDYNTRTVSSGSSWSEITCYLDTGATAVTTPYVYFVEEGSAVRTFGVDTFAMTLATSTTPNVQIGGGVNGGPTTLFTLDRGASAPIAGDNEALLGSMYYDTTLGKLQCYEADGWGACGSSPDNIVTISPEYTNAVMHGTGVGTMISDLCSDFLNINDGSSGQDTVCDTNETFNYYNWTSPQASSQTYSIYVTYQLPGSFRGFASGETYVDGRKDHATNATLTYQLYKSNLSSGLTSCGSAVTIVSTADSWERGIATGTADPSTCGFAASDSIVFQITTTTRSNANVYIGNLGFTFSNR